MCNYKKNKKHLLVFEGVDYYDLPRRSLACFDAHLDTIVCISNGSHLGLQINHHEPPHFEAWSQKWNPRFITLGLEI